MTETLDRTGIDLPSPPGHRSDGPVPSPSSSSPPGRSWARLALVVGALLTLGVWAGWIWVAVVVAFLVSVFLHEMGHFVAARVTGMKVSEFFISFGPRIWSFHRGETEYGLKTIPAGAYVRITGMSNLEDVDPADEGRTYRSKSYPKRLAVVLAGPFANFALALVLFVAAFAGFGVAGTDWTVSRVVSGSAAETAGFQPGDRVLSVGDQEVSSWADFGRAVAATRAEPTDAVVERDGQEVVLSVQAGWRLSPDTAALVPPLSEEDVIRSVNGEAVTSYEQFRQLMASLPAGTADVAFQRGGGEYHSPDVAVPVTLPEMGTQPFFGLGPRYEQERLGPLQAVGESFSAAGSLVAGAGQGLARFFSFDGLSDYKDLLTAPPTGDGATVVGSQQILPVDQNEPAAVDPASDPANEARPVSIIGLGRLLGQAADSGVGAFVFLLAAINLMLGLFNLLPLPPLDGGHALVASYEAVRGRISGRAYRVDMAKLIPVTYAVMLVLIGLGLTSMWLDAVKPLDNPYGP